MPSAKIVFRDGRPYKDGTCPVMLRVIVDRKATEVQLCRIHPRDWNADKNKVRSTHPQHVRLNNLIRDRLRQAEDGIDDAERDAQPVAAAALLKRPRPGGNRSFLDLIREYIQARTAKGKIHTAEKYESHLVIFRRFLAPRPDVPVQELTEDLILRYIRWERDRGTSANTLDRRLGFFSGVMNRYCQAEGRAGRFVFNPFSSEAAKVAPQKARKHRLTPEEVEALEALELPDNRMHHARLCWLLQYYLRGIRISDALLLRRENIVGDRVEFTTLKTAAFHSVQIHPKLDRLLDQLLAYKSRYLLPLMTWKPDPALTPDENTRAMWRQIESKTMIVNQNLQRIEKRLGLSKPLRSHIARHTFAREADRRVTDKRKIQGMLGHHSFKMTENYLEGLRDDDLDAAAAEVFA